jgi:hypothetical protein
VSILWLGCGVCDTAGHGGRQLQGTQQQGEQGGYVVSMSANSHDSTQQPWLALTPHSPFLHSLLLSPPPPLCRTRCARACPRRPPP